MNIWMNAFTATAHASSFMPTPATDIAHQVDNLYSFLLWSSLVACAILIGGMIFFVIKYRKKAETKSAYITHNTALEFLWSFIPLVIFLAVFAWGWLVFHQMRTPPENALEIHVIGKQWSWDFAYKSGKVSTNEFYVPVNTPVKLIISSRDVLHSFYLPSMRIKQDAVPGRYTSLWFNSTKLGDFHVFCTEYCGSAHSAMLARMKVVSQADYEAWLQEDDSKLTLAERGQKYYNSKGCVACHTTDGSARVGPSLKGLFGKDREFADGSNTKADENYLRESILNSNAKIVKGFPAGQMPTFQGQLTEDELNALIDFIKGVK